jgi:probable rRNA maturation factor
VLSFPIDEDDDLPVGLPRMLGDVVVCPAQVARQADEASVPPGHELATMAVHGTLHLLGFDHERDAGEMLERQDALMAAVADVAWTRA